MYVIGKICLVCGLIVGLVWGVGHTRGHAKGYLQAVGSKPLLIKTEDRWQAVVLPSLEEWAAVVKPDPVEEEKPLPEAEEDVARTEKIAELEPVAEEERAEHPEEATESDRFVEESQYFTRWDDEILRYFLGVDSMGTGDREIRVMLPAAFEPPRPVEGLRGRATYRQE